MAQLLVYSIAVSVTSNTNFEPETGTMRLKPLIALNDADGTVMWYSQFCTVTVSHEPGTTAGTAEDSVR